MNKNRELLIEKIAESVRDECNVTDYGFHNIFEAGEKIGYRVIRYPIGSETFLGFALIKESDRIIFSNSSQILSREIFSIAHEMGHHKLHLTNQDEAIILDDDFSDIDENEREANHFAACLLMPVDKVAKFIRLELKDKKMVTLNGLDVARIQNAFNVSYDMALVRLKTLGIIDDYLLARLRIEKVQQTATRLLKVIGGNSDLCKSADVKKVPAEYLEWVISNYTEKLIPKTSLENALNYVGVNVENFENPTDEEDEEICDNFFRRID